MIKFKLNKGVVAYISMWCIKVNIPEQIPSVLALNLKTRLIGRFFCLLRLVFCMLKTEKAILNTEYVRSLAYEWFKCYFVTDWLCFTH